MREQIPDRQAAWKTEINTDRQTELKYHMKGIKLNKKSYVRPYLVSDLSKSRLKTHLYKEQHTTHSPGHLFIASSTQLHPSASINIRGIPCVTTCEGYAMRRWHLNVNSSFDLGMIMLQIILDIVVTTMYDTEWEKTLKFECAKLRKLKNRCFGEYFEFSRQTGSFQKKSRVVCPNGEDTWTDAV